MHEDDLARRYAISLLSRRNYLSSDLEERLMRKGFSEQAAKAAALYCSQKGFVDDAKEIERQFAKLQRKGKSARAAFFQLKGKVSDTLLERRYREACELDEEALRSFVEKKKIDLSDPKALRKLYARGFSMDLILRLKSDI